MTRVHRYSAEQRRLRAIASYCKDLQQDIKDGCRSFNSGSDLFNILETSSA